ncbi:zf-HC2 domain-containing protein [Xanthomonas sp. LMG 8992]|uniref:zf-HC2 domain-containing protein n=1 Tax=Xanthomonas sp. LMG 8992 TaxID=1591157 RepID=UPI00137103A9|nr:zf-HC2 domain-containing protein [Xanthomonas sp. LMG 8992]MXV11720.1 zf-HC2 domain-containing protein [Xanthomonas sp. LMG 8992]
MKTGFNEPGNECAHAWELMPWVLQDSATEEDNEWLVAHLAKCQHCSAEFAQQSRLRLAMTLPSDVPVDAEAGLQRLLQRLDAPVPQAQPQRSRTSWTTRALVAAALLQAVGLGVLGMRLSAEHERSTAYRTLSDAAQPLAADAIRVVPDARMTLADWDVLLRKLQLRVIGGPNAAGAYTVVPTQAGSAAQPQRSVQQLRATAGIRLAEPIAAP